MGVAKDLFSLSAFPKSGVTYLSFMLFHALGTEDRPIEQLEQRYVIDIHAYPEAEFAEDAKPRLIKSHYSYARSMPFADRIAKAVLLVRHPIDVMMSAWNFALLTSGAAPGRKNPAMDDPEFRTFAFNWITSGGGSMFAEFGSWRDHIESWNTQTDIEILAVRYEDMLDRPRAELERVLSFLGLQVPEHRILGAVERSSMKVMAEREDKEMREGRAGVFHRPEVEAGFANGYRFINAASRRSFSTRLTEEEQVVALAMFEDGLSRYYPTDLAGA